MEAAGGILAASRLIAVNQASGSAMSRCSHRRTGGKIAGTSRSARARLVALLGAVVIGSISNGMDLLGLTRTSST